MTEATAVNVSEIATSVTGMFGDFSVSNLLIFIGAGVGIAAALVLPISASLKEYSPASVSGITGT